MSAATPEKGPLLTSSPTAAPAVVSQPLKAVEGLASILESINAMSESAPARVGENQAGASGGTTAAAGGGQTGDDGVSPRDLAIASIPDEAVMQREIAKHIKVEVRQLRKEARRIARASGPGSAFHLVQIYAKIHRLTSLFGEILEAGYEVVKRLYIRIFIDRQAIL